MKNHDEFKQLISADSDGELSGPDKNALQHHLAECPECAAYQKDLKKLSLSLASWTNEDLSPDFELKQERSQKKEGHPMKLISKFSLAGVGGALVVGALAWLAITHIDRGILPQPVPKPAMPVVAATPIPVTPIAPLVTPPAVPVPGPVADQKAATLPQTTASSAPLKLQAAQLAVPTDELLLRRESEMKSMRFVTAERAPLAAGAKGISYDRSLSIIPSQPAGEWNTESYATVEESGFKEAKSQPLSTFSIDVDTASYSNLRRFLNSDQMPPKDAIRIEEMINYFVYNYPNPEGTEPFSVTTELASCPWKEGRELLLVGIQGRKPEVSKLPPNNIVFLADVSGSMEDPNKLPLLVKGLRMMVQNLRPEDRVAIVTYAGAAGLALPSTTGEHKDKILDALDRLQAGGSTAGGAGIKLAYSVAEENFIKDGNNRIILATDGDFNIGASSDGDMTRLIEEKRASGVFLTVLGFGEGNLKDSKMEQIADHGNGNYFYIDSLNEAKKVLVSELGSTLVTIAKDVKIQVEFNPAKVKAYRLIGYENRALANEDFKNDRKDAGELGAGHTVTALYEIIRADSKEKVENGTDPLIYQNQETKTSDDLLTVKLRYKEPKEDTSREIRKAVPAQVAATPSANFELATTVAEFGLLLRRSDEKGTAGYPHVLDRAKKLTSDDLEGYKAELVKLIEKASNLDAAYSAQGKGLQFK